MHACLYIHKATYIYKSCTVQAWVAYLKSHEMSSFQPEAFVNYVPRKPHNLTRLNYVNNYYSFSDHCQFALFILGDILMSSPLLFTSSWTLNYYFSLRQWLESQYRHSKILIEPICLYRDHSHIRISAVTCISRMALYGRWSSKPNGKK